MRFYDGTPLTAYDVVFASEKCGKEEPPLIEVGKGHFVACWRVARS